jgi:hypothetical protein
MECYGMLIQVCDVNRSDAAFVSLTTMLNMPSTGRCVAWVTVRR